MEKLYIDKGNQAQIIDWLTSRGYPRISFDERQDHLG